MPPRPTCRPSSSPARPSGTHFDAAARTAAVRGRPGTSRPGSGCARRDRPGGRSWRCTVTSTCASPPTPMAPQVLGIRPDDRCYSVGPMFHAYGLGNSLSFPFSVGATAIVEPTRPPTPALVGEIARSLQPTLLFCIPTFYAALCAVRPAGRHVRVRALGSVGGRAAARRHLSTASRSASACASSTASGRRR